MRGSCRLQWRQSASNTATAAGHRQQFLYRIHVTGCCWLCSHRRQAQPIPCAPTKDRLSPPQGAGAIWSARPRHLSCPRQLPQQRPAACAASCCACPLCLPQPLLPHCLPGGQQQSQEGSGRRARRRSAGIEPGSAPREIRWPACPKAAPLQRQGQQGRSGMFRHCSCSLELCLLSAAVNPLNMDRAGAGICKRNLRTGGRHPGALTQLLACGSWKQAVTRRA